MKKISGLILASLLAAMTFTFTSCEEDGEIAYTLEGTWKGDMYIQSIYNGVTYNASYSEICFLRNPYKYSSGDGYWVDYYSRAPWDYVANHITWNVTNGIIYVHLVEDNCSYYIYDYSLNDDYFTGKFYDGGSYISFSMYHTSSPNWEDYGWGYDYWYSSYYSKGNTVTSRSGTEGSTDAEKPVRSLRTPDNQ